MILRVYDGPDACKSCGGAGSRSYSDFAWYPCGRCKGNGTIKVREDGSDYAYLMPCPACGGGKGYGTGSISYGRCKDCGGTGRQQAKEGEQGA